MSEIKSDDPEIQTSTKLRRRILRMIKEEDASNWSVLHACLFIVAEVAVDMPDREEGVAAVHRKLDEMLAMIDSIGATTQRASSANVFSICGRQATFRGHTRRGSRGGADLRETCPRRQNETRITDRRGKAI